MPRPSLGLALVIVLLLRRSEARAPRALLQTGSNTISVNQSSSSNNAFNLPASPNSLPQPVDWASVSSASASNQVFQALEPYLPLPTAVLEGIQGALAALPPPAVWLSSGDITSTLEGLSLGYNVSGTVQVVAVHQDYGSFAALAPGASFSQAANVTFTDVLLQASVFGGTNLSDDTPGGHAPLLVMLHTLSCDDGNGGPPYQLEPSMASLSNMPLGNLITVTVFRVPTGADQPGTHFYIGRALTVGKTILDARSLVVHAPDWIQNPTTVGGYLACADLSHQQVLSSPTDQVQNVSGLVVQTGDFVLSAWAAAAGLKVNGSALLEADGANIVADVAITVALPGGSPVGWPSGVPPTNDTIQFDVFRTSCSLLGLAGYILGSGDNPAIVTASSGPPTGPSFNATGVVSNSNDGGGAVSDGAGKVGSVCVSKTLTLTGGGDHAAYVAASRATTLVAYVFSAAANSYRSIACADLSPTPQAAAIAANIGACPAVAYNGTAGGARSAPPPAAPAASPLPAWAAAVIAVVGGGILAVSIAAIALMCRRRANALRATGTPIRCCTLCCCCPPPPPPRRGSRLGPPPPAPSALWRPTGDAAPSGAEGPLLAAPPHVTITGNPVPLHTAATLPPGALTRWLSPVRRTISGGELAAAPADAPQIAPEAAAAVMPAAAPPPGQRPLPPVTDPEDGGPPSKGSSSASAHSGHSNHSGRPRRPPPASPGAKSPGGAALVTDESEAESESSHLQRALSGHAFREINAAEIKLVRRIGVGAFGECLLARWAGTEVAVKRVWGVQTSELAIPHVPPGEDDDPDDEPPGPPLQAAPAAAARRLFWADFLNEVRLLASLRHPHVVQFLGAARVPPDMLLVMEWVPRGSLYDVLHRAARSVPLDYRRRVRMCRDAARGMAFLHSQTPPIIHRDLKTANLLVGAHFNVKVADFGLSRTREATFATGTLAFGTPQYAAPELLLNKPYGEPADVYSWGVVLFEVLTNQKPFSTHTSPMQIITAVAFQGEKLPPLPQSVAGEHGADTLQRLIIACTADNPASRPTFNDILAVMEEVFQGTRPPAAGEGDALLPPGPVAPISAPQPPPQPPLSIANGAEEVPAPGPVCGDPSEAPDVRTLA